MAWQIEQWPDEVIALNKELANGLHQSLAQILENVDPATSFAERIGHIAAYCDLILDGQYMPEDIANICGELCKRLEAKRVRPAAQVILPLN